MTLIETHVHPKRPRGLAARAFALLRHPVQEWAAIAAEDEAPLRLIVRYALPLAAAPAAARAVGLAIFGARDHVGAFRLRPLAIVLDASAGYALALVALGVLAALASIGARLVGGGGERFAPTRLAVYASTAGWLGGVCNITPLTRPLGAAAALYGVVLFIAGSRALVRPPKGSLGLYAVTVLALFAVAEWLTAGAVRLVFALA